MADEARGILDFDKERVLLTTSITAREVVQAPSGLAGVWDSEEAKNVGDYTELTTAGTFTVAKSTGFVVLPGNRAYWDHSANSATYRKVHDRDYYIGRWKADASSGSTFAEVGLNEDPPYDIDVNRDPVRTAIIGTQPGLLAWTEQIGTRAKVGATAGWVVGAADNLPYVATLAASQTASTLVVPIDGLRIGDTITGFRVVAQIESAGAVATLDGDLRATTNVAAEPTDASIGTMTQVSVTADTASSQEKTGLTEVVTSGKTYYLKITGTTAALTDIILQACEITVTRGTATNSVSLVNRGGAWKFVINANSEAQKIDILSKDGFATGANAIVEFAYEVVSDGAGTVVDVSLGIASATHATDASSITNRLFVHLDANVTTNNLESSDGTTTVAITSTTTAYTEGTREEWWMDLRNPADPQIYRNGVLMLTASVFSVTASVATWYLLAHIEKTAATDTYELDLDWMRVHYAEQ